METKFTPGPWEAVVDLVRSEYGTNEGGVGGGGLLVADCSAIGMPGTANARLISAAPELLELVERIRSFFGVDDSPLTAGMRMYRDDIDAAIAKAKGKA